MRINTAMILELRPCQSRLDNYLQYYAQFDGTIEDFIKLPDITHQDKLWVILRLIPRFELEVFAIDCAVSVIFHSAYAAYADAAAYAAAAYADAAAYAAAAYADAAAYAAAAYADAAYADAAAYAAAAYAAAAYDVDIERKRQLNVLVYLVNNIGNE